MSFQLVFAVGLYFLCFALLCAGAAVFFSTLRLGSVLNFVACPLIELSNFWDQEVVWRFVPTSLSQTVVCFPLIAQCLSAS